MTTIITLILITVLGHQTHAQAFRGRWGFRSSWVGHIDEVSFPNFLWNHPSPQPPRTCKNWQTRQPWLLETARWEPDQDCVSEQLQISFLSSSGWAWTRALQVINDWMFYKTRWCLSCDQLEIDIEYSKLRGKNCQEKEVSFYLALRSLERQKAISYLFSVWQPGIVCVWIFIREIIAQ